MASISSSAKPGNLQQYHVQTRDMDESLRVDGESLRGILYTFEAQCTEGMCRVGAAYLADDVVSFASDASQKDDWVGRVGNAFVLADTKALLMTPRQPIPVPMPVPTPAPPPGMVEPDPTLSDLEEMINGDADYQRLIEQLGQVARQGGNVYDLIEAVEGAPKLRMFMGTVIKYQKGVRGARRATSLGPINPGSILTGTALADLETLADYTVGNKRYDSPERLQWELATNHYIVLLGDIAGGVGGGAAAIGAVELGLTAPLAGAVFVAADFIIGYAVEGGLEWMRGITLEHLVPDETIDRRRAEFFDDWTANTGRYARGELDYADYQAAQRALIEALGDATITVLVTDENGQAYVHAACYERPNWKTVEVLTPPTPRPAPTPAPSPRLVLDPYLTSVPAAQPSPTVPAWRVLLPGASPLNSLPTPMPAPTPVPTPAPTATTSSAAVGQRFSDLLNFAWGFIIGSGHEIRPEYSPYSNEAAIAGDFVASLLVYGDVRDIVWYLVNTLRSDVDASEATLVMSLIGLVPLSGDALGVLKPVVKALDKTPEPVREAGMGLISFAVRQQDHLDEVLDITRWLAKNHDTPLGRAVTDLLSYAAADSSRYPDAINTIQWLTTHTDEAAPLVGRNLPTERLMATTFEMRLGRLPLPAADLPRPTNLYGYSAADMGHFLQDHTWAYLDPAARAQKAANSTSLWPAGTTADDVARYLQEALDKHHATGGVIQPGQPARLTLDNGITVQLGVATDLKTIGQFFPVSGPGVETYSRGLIQTVSQGLGQLEEVAH